MDNTINKLINFCDEYNKINFLDKIEFRFTNKEGGRYSILYGLYKNNELLFSKSDDINNIEEIVDGKLNK